MLLAGVGILKTESLSLDFLEARVVSLYLKAKVADNFVREARILEPEICEAHIVNLQSTFVLSFLVTYTEVNAVLLKGFPATA